MEEVEEKTTSETQELPADYLEKDYDAWLEFFRKIPAETLRAMHRDWSNKIPAEGYAALARWIEIIANPSKMDKLYKGRIDRENDGDIMALAIGDDDEAFYSALIRKNVAQLDSSNISQQEVARLSQNINIFRKELREIRSRRPKTGTVLEKVIKAANLPEKSTVAKKTTSSEPPQAKKNKKTEVK